MTTAQVESTPEKKEEPETSRFDNLLALVTPYTEHLDELVAVFIVALIVGISFWRLRFGVDFSDEAFYAGITQRFSLGDLPYLDEYNLRQSASLIPVPFYWLFLKIMGSTDGCVYFLRLIYFGFQLFTGWTIYRFAVARLPRSFALVAATLPVVYIPFGIPTCSYNNLGGILFAAGTFLGLRSILDEPKPRWFIGAGVVHGLSCIAYPPMAIPVTCFAIAGFLRVEQLRSPDARSELWRRLKPYMVGLLGVALLLFLVLIPGLIHHGVREALNYEHQTTHPRTSDKAKQVIMACATLMPLGKQGWLAALAAFAALGKVMPASRKWIAAGLFGYFFWYFRETQPEYTLNCNSLYLTIFLGIYGVVFLAFVDRGQRGEEAKLLALAGWAPSLLAGFISGFATDNFGCINGGVGLFAAAALALVAAPLGANVESFSRPMRALGVVVLALIPLAELDLNTTATYRSGLLSSNTTLVRTGPYRWMRGQPPVVRQAEEMTKMVRPLVHNGDRMLAYYDFPAAYLAAETRPAIPTTWTDRRAKLPLLFPYYHAHRDGSGYVFAMTAEHGICPELEAMVEDPSRIVSDIGWARMYREPPVR